MFTRRRLGLYIILLVMLLVSQVIMHISFFSRQLIDNNINDYGLSIYGLNGNIFPGYNQICICDDSFIQMYNGSFGLMEHEKSLFVPPEDKKLMSKEYIADVSSSLGVPLQLANNSGYLQWKRPGPTQSYNEKTLSESSPYVQVGYDPICSKQDKFRSINGWFRDDYISEECRTQPRERALGFVLANILHIFNRTGVVIHESSPNDFGSSFKFKSMFPKYVSSQYSFTVPCGQPVSSTNGDFSLDLENQYCIPDSSYDIIISQDVFEHIYDPEKAFAEIARTLKPGGFHIFTVPLTSKQYKTFRAAVRDIETGKVNLYAPPEIHGNPMGQGGSLLTTQWGYDIVNIIKSATNRTMDTKVIYVESDFLGIQFSEYREVLVSQKVGSNAFFPTDIWNNVHNIRSGMCSHNMIKCNTLKDV